MCLEYLEQIKENFYSYKGRLNRKPYIIRYGILIIIMILNKLLAQGLGGPNVGHGLVFNIVVVLIGVSIFMIDIKRLHDLGKSGYWVLLMFVPLVNIIFLIYLLLAKGEPTENKYGPDLLDYVESN